LDRFFAYQNPKSFVNRLRSARFMEFQQWIEKAGLASKPEVRVLDMGGTYGYWKRLKHQFQNPYHVTLLNLYPEKVPADVQWIGAIQGDVCRLRPEEFQSFDCLFSNSLIEHLGSREAMRAFAAAITASGRPYYIQTPSFWFPLEPHCRIPLFQFLPRNFRAWLIWNFKINYFPAAENYEDCKQVSDSTILLTRRDLQDLFPDARIQVERLFGWVKSYTAIYPCSPDEENKAGG
jgi:hypothetical protein